MNILIVKLSAIGDVVHTLPSLAALRKHYPAAHITWVIEEAAADLIAGHPYLDRVLVSRRKIWIRDIKNGRNVSAVFREISAFVRTLRDRPYDLVIDFHGLFKSAVVVLLSGGKRKLGYDSMQEMSGLFLNEKIREDMEKHAVDRYLDFPRYLGADASAPEFLIPLEEENRLRIDSLLSEEGIDRGTPFIAVNPVAYWKTKLWRDERFALLCDSIMEELGIPIILTGGSGDRSLSRIERLMKNPCINFAGKTTLRDLAALYQRARLVVTTDSGPMHIAAAMGTPTVALFGPTNPDRTGPYGAGHRVVRKDLHCSPCLRKECDTMQCMRDISVEEVLNAVKEILRRQE